MGLIILAIHLLYKTRLPQSMLIAGDLLRGGAVIGHGRKESLRRVCAKEGAHTLSYVLQIVL